MQDLIMPILRRLVLVESGVATLALTITNLYTTIDLPWIAILSPLISAINLLSAEYALQRALQFARERIAKGL